jgi:hypothetical protein
MLPKKIIGIIFKKGIDSNVIWSYDMRGWTTKRSLKDLKGNVNER